MKKGGRVLIPHFMDITHYHDITLTTAQKIHRRRMNDVVRLYAVMNSKHSRHETTHWAAVVRRTFGPLPCRFPLHIPTRLHSQFLPPRPMAELIVPIKMMCSTDWTVPRAGIIILLCSRTSRYICSTATKSAHRSSFPSCQRLLLPPEISLERSPALAGRA